MLSEGSSPDGLNELLELQKCDWNPGLSGGVSQGLSPLPEKFLTTVAGGNKFSSQSNPHVHSLNHIEWQVYHVCETIIILSLFPDLFLILCRIRGTDLVWPEPYMWISSIFYGREGYTFRRSLRFPFSKLQLFTYRWPNWSTVWGWNKGKCLQYTMESSLRVESYEHLVTLNFFLAFHNRSNRLLAYSNLGSKSFFEQHVGNSQHAKSRK